MFCLTSILASLLFLYLNPGPREHFEVIAPLLGGKVVHLFDWRGDGDAIVTEAGDIAFSAIHRQLENEGIAHYVYCDNPESHVSGGYSMALKHILQENPTAVFYANANLAQEGKSYGIGFYSVEKAKMLKKKREGRHKEGITAVFLGANNKHFYERGFDRMVALSQGLPESWSLYYLRHPRANDEDLKKLPAQLSLSPYSFDDMMVEADIVFYDQSSVIAQLNLAGIRTIQIDEDLKEALCRPLPLEEEILASVGYRSDWKERVLSLSFLKNN